MLKGAKQAGLKLDTEAGTRIHSFHPDYLAPVRNVAHFRKGITDLVVSDRVGPEDLWQLSSAAKRRWLAPPRAGEQPYRPASLNRVASELNKLPPWHFTPPTDLLDTVKAREEDTLSKLAVHYYRDNDQWKAIYAANLDTILDPNEIFPGQIIRIPRLPPPASDAPSAVSETATCTSPHLPFDDTIRNQGQ